MVRKRTTCSERAEIKADTLAFFRRKLLAWFRRYGRRLPWRKTSARSYELIVAEILLKRTRAETVRSYFPAFLKRFPSWGVLAAATEGQLRSYLQPIGLWRQRAAALRALAAEMVRRRGRFPRDREAIERLPGVGQYVANAILLFCHGERQPLVDVNMARVLERFFGPRQLVDIRDCPYLQSLAKTVVNTGEAVSVNWAVLDLAALVCRVRSPDCRACPLNRRCRFAQERRTNAPGSEAAAGCMIE